MNEYEKMLEARNIRVTAVRLLVLKAMQNHPQAFNLADIEQKLETIDKSTLFRTITLFHEKQLIHSIDDGSGSIKYSVCSKDCHCVPKDLHVHFFCLHCKKTFCLESIHIPQIALPQGFSMQSANYVIKGICSHCPKSQPGCTD